ncbi:MAG: hypothetical protein WBV46_20490 [Terriglobales bacterium]
MHASAGSQRAVPKLIFLIGSYKWITRAKSRALSVLADVARGLIAIVLFIALRLFSVIDWREHFAIIERTGSFDFVRFSSNFVQDTEQGF